MNKFSEFDKFVIYGIGVKTQELIERYSDKVYGLMDKSSAGEIYGKRIISESEVVESGIKTIVIAARQAATPIIYRRISKLCRVNGIACYNIDGEIITDTKSEQPLNFEIFNIDEIKQKIENADVISFDVFDTLIIRSCLYPDDVFEIAGDNDIFEIELVLAEPRSELVEIYNFSLKQGKQIYFVSDMYLSANYIQKILAKCGVNAETENIIVSCEHDVSKTNGLFELLKSGCNSRNIIHIGDSYEADYLAAKQYGIESIKIDSRLEVLQKSEYSEILKYDTTFENRLVIAKLLTSDLSLADMISPIIYKFFAWIKDKSKEFDVVLLGARDGYLIDLIRQTIPNCDFNGIYFLTSRTVAVSASLFNESDIERVKQYPFSGSESELYKNRFITDVAVQNFELLKHSADLRTNYLKYADSLQIQSESKVAFMDFVSSGTCYNALKRILPFGLTGLFAIKLGEKDSNIEMLFEDYEESALYKNYFILEEILCSQYPTLKCFDETGEPINFEEKRSQVQLENLKQLQTKIIEYVKRTQNIDFSEVDLGLCDYIFGMAKQSAVFAEDEFCGR